MTQNLELGEEVLLQHCSQCYLGLIFWLRHKMLALVMRRILVTVMTLFLMEQL